MSDYDAVVVGAGPAGAAAAYALASGGARVVVLERAQIPRYKPCGGGLTGRARALSPLAAAFAPETRALHLSVRGDTHAFTVAAPSPIDMTMRDRFDAYLMERAIAAGTQLRDGVSLDALTYQGSRVRLTAGGETVRAAYVVGADGANGVTARLAGFPPAREPATAIEVELDVPGASLAHYQETALLDFAVVRGGYAWIFGKGDHLSVGVYTVYPHERRALRPALERFLATHPHLRDGRMRMQRGHRVPLAGGRTRHRGRVVLAGDAAALADPLTGEGISYALASGQRAGLAILQALAGDPRALPAYDRYLTHDLSRDLRYARLVAALAYRRPDLLLRLTDEDAQVRAVAAAAVCGSGDYRAVASRLARSAPTLLRYALGYATRL